MARLLLVEDDVYLGESLKEGLELEGHYIELVTTGSDALLAFETDDFNLAIMDINLPKLSGLDVLKQIRKKQIQVPILMLTANNSIEQRILGLDMGADDYMGKPFDIDELCARIRSLTRRAGGRSDPKLQVGKFLLDPATHDFFIAGTSIFLSAKERNIMQALMENAGRYVAKSKLENGLYGWDSEVESNTIEVYISSLRKKIGKQYISTMRGVGYIMHKA